ncbi:hypothetical protein [Salinicola halophilus]|uniref:hypothetical protein n=1 Tax=Salinicola halophilus TaxID=184065 RepID=UPI000DA1DA22|nr:hypothetical protein [Salinicola halophilus]
MAGLDTRGLADGLSQGIGLGMRMQDQQRRQQHDKVRMQQYERGLAMREQEFDQRQQGRQREMDQQIAQSGYARLAAGQELDDEQIEAFKRQPWMAPWHVASDEVGAAIDTAARVIDSDDPSDLNDPESIEALNAMFGPRINRGHGTKKRIRAAIPGQKPGTLAFDLDVEDAEGNRYTAPMTRNRGAAGDDDEVMQTDVGDIINQVAGYQQLRGALTPKARQRAVEYGRSLGFLPEQEREDQWEMVDGPRGSKIAINSRTGEPKQVIGPDNSRGSGAARGAPNSATQEAQWLVQQGIAPDIQTAYGMVTRAGQDDDYNRQKDQLDYVDNQIGQLVDVQTSTGFNSFGPDEQAKVNSQLEALRQRRERIASSMWQERQPAGNPHPRGLNMSGAAGDSQPAPGNPDSERPIPTASSGSNSRYPAASSGGQSGDSTIETFRNQFGY